MNKGRPSELNYLVGLASQAMAALRELVVSPSVSESSRLKAALATVQSVGALDPESLSSAYAEKIETGWNRDRMMDDLI